MVGIVEKEDHKPHKEDIEGAGHYVFRMQKAYVSDPILPEVQIHDDQAHSITRTSERQSTAGKEFQVLAKEGKHTLGGGVILCPILLLSPDIHASPPFG